MKTLKTVLEELGESHVQLGGSLSSDTREALATHRRRCHAAYFSLYFIILATVVIAVVVAAAMGLQGREGIEVFGGVMGLVVGGAMQFLRRCVREWSDSTLLMILLDGATEAETRKIIMKLVSSRSRR